MRALVDGYNSYQRQLARIQNQAPPQDLTESHFLNALFEEGQDPVDKNLGIPTPRYDRLIQRELNGTADPNTKRERRINFLRRNYFSDEQLSFGLHLLDNHFCLGMIDKGGDSGLKSAYVAPLPSFFQWPGEHMVWIINDGIGSYSINDMPVYSHWEYLGERAGNIVHGDAEVRQWGFNPPVAQLPNQQQNAPNNPRELSIQGQGVVNFMQRSIDDFFGRRGAIQDNEAPNEQWSGLYALVRAIFFKFDFVCSSADAIFLGVISRP